MQCDGDACNFVFFDSECPDSAVTEEQVKLLNSKLDYLKRALNQQFLQSPMQNFFAPAKLFWGIWRQSSEADYATLLKHFFCL